MIDVAIIGAGPAGLWAAENLAQAGFRVCVFDSMPSPARKFLRAGIGGLNLTHSEPLPQFIDRFGANAARFKPLLESHGPAQIMAWADELGADCFTGSSGRVFPKVMKASPLLRRWLARLDQLGVTFHFKQRLSQISQNHLRFADGSEIHPRAVLLALGGASWPKLGSDGDWVNWDLGVKIAPFKPANGGFLAPWSDYFAQKFQGQPVKSVRLSFGDRSLKGEFVITQSGVEGSAIYALSAQLRDEILENGRADLRLDLKPDWDQAKLQTILNTPRSAKSTATYLAKTCKLSPTAIGLLNELARPLPQSPQQLAHLIKNLELPLVGVQSIDWAISSAGGVCFDSLDDHLMGPPGVFFSGEMLDWEAPTGGYLLTGCYALAHQAATGIRRYLGQPGG